MELKLEIPVHLSKRDIASLMQTALESGITAWGKANEADAREISRGNPIIVYSRKGNVKWQLTSEMLQKGIEKYLSDIEHLTDVVFDGELDIECLGYEEVDTIMQYALFGDVIYDKKGRKRL